MRKVCCLSGGGEHFSTNDFALNLLVFLCLELSFVAVEFELNGGTDDEVGSVHRLLGVCAAGVGLALRLEKEIVDLMLIVLGLDTGRLDFFQGGAGLELVGEGWERKANDRDPKDQRQTRFAHCGSPRGDCSADDLHASGKLNPEEGPRWYLVLVLGSNIWRWDEALALQAPRWAQRR